MKISFNLTIAVSPAVRSALQEGKEKSKQTEKKKLKLKTLFVKLKLM
jgi:hypothetical protein